MRPEFKFGRNGELSVEAKQFSFRMDLPDRGLFTLKLGTTFRLESLPAQLGEYSEILALADRRRPHVLESGELTLDVPGSIPFGAAPSILRKFRFSEDYMTVVSDFGLRNSFAMKEISAGGLRIVSELVRIGIVTAPAKSCRIPKTVWREIGECPELVYSSEEPPLMLLLEASDGVILEFSVGEDFWRWINAARMDADSCFTLKKSGENEWLFNWNIFALRSPEQEPPAGRNWRLSWSLAWRVPKKMKKSSFKTESYKSVFDFAGDHSWKESSLCMEADGTYFDAVCLASPEALNALKRWLRSCLADASEGDVFAVLNAEPHFCRSAAHMERPKLKLLPHWDAPALQDFKRWADKQLASKGARLEIVK